MPTTPHSDRTSGYHLFLEPGGAFADSLRAMIRALAESCGGPVFPPHVTLLAEMQEAGKDKAAQLAQQAAPFALALGEEGVEDAYFRALYLQVQESAALSALHAHAAELFSMPNESYMPHLSLLYGNYPEEQKRAAFAALPAFEPLSFVIDRISLYRTEGTVSDWELVQVFPLGE